MTKLHNASSNLQVCTWKWLSALYFVFSFSYTRATLYIHFFNKIPNFIGDPHPAPNKQCKMFWYLGHSLQPIPFATQIFCLFSEHIHVGHFFVHTFQNNLSISPTKTQMFFSHEQNTHFIYWKLFWCSKHHIPRYTPLTSISKAQHKMKIHVQIFWLCYLKFCT